MKAMWTRRELLAGIGAGAVAAALPAQAMEAPPVGLAYPESLAAPGALNPRVAYIPPSRIDPAYSHAIYVNTALSGPGAQKMWVLRRGAGGWKLALWDETYWQDKGVAGTPPYSWPVSTGRKYPGDARSGPTPTGIFNVDDRRFRHRRGWGSPGMYNSIYIDLHYGSGRMSGIAMHGTPRSNYRKLGRADSHGCIRMTQANSEMVWRLFHGEGRPGATSPLWTETVPRYFTSTPTSGYTARWGYVRDGSILSDAETGARLTKSGYAALFVFFRDDY